MEGNRNKEVSFQSRNKLTPYAMRFALPVLRSPASWDVGERPLIFKMTSLSIDDFLSPYLPIFILMDRANFFMDDPSFFRDFYKFMDVPFLSLLL